jgi:hypothetical protein
MFFVSVWTDPPRQHTGRTKRIPNDFRSATYVKRSMTGNALSAGNLFECGQAAMGCDEAVRGGKKNVGPAKPTARPAFSIYETGEIATGDD